MSKTSGTELLSKLKSSLEKPAPPVSPPTTNPPPAAPANPLLPVSRAPKLSVSLYQADLRRLDEIKDFMRNHGFRNLSDSEALRLACRAVQIGDGFLPIYQKMQQEDGRRRG